MKTQFYAYQSYKPNFGSKKIQIGKIQELLKTDKSMDEIAQMCDMSISNLHTIIRKFNIEGKRKLKQKQLDSILPAYINNDVSRLQTSKETGIGLSAIHTWIKSHLNETPREYKKRKMNELIHTTLPNKEIAEQLGISINTVKAARVRANAGNRQRKKEEHWNMIREKLQEGLSLAQIAKEVNLSKSTISKYIKFFLNNGINKA